MFSIRSPILLPEGVKVMTVISMEQEAVPAGFPTTYRQALGALATGAPALRPAFEEHIPLRWSVL